MRCSVYLGLIDPGVDKLSFGYGGTGKKSHDKQFDNYGEAYGLGDTLGCFLDMDSGDVSFRLELSVSRVVQRYHNRCCVLVGIG